MDPLIIQVFRISKYTSRDFGLTTTPLQVRHNFLKIIVEEAEAGKHLEKVSSII